MARTSFSLVVWCVLLVVGAAAAITSREARAELRLPDKYSQKELKAAYRKRSVAVHPDKGGSTEEFLRVSEAFELLSTGGGGDSGAAPGGRGSRPRRSSFGADVPRDEQVKRAEEMFDSVLDELMEMMGEVGGGLEGLMDELLGEVRGPFKWILKKALKAGTRALAKAVGHAFESDSVNIKINGQQMSGRDFKEWRERRQAARPAVRGTPPSRGPRTRTRVAGGGSAGRRDEL